MEVARNTVLFSLTRTLQTRSGAQRAFNSTSAGLLSQVQSGQDLMSTIHIILAPRL